MKGEKITVGPPTSNKQVGKSDHYTFHSTTAKKKKKGRQGITDRLVRDL